MLYSLTGHMPQLTLRINRWAVRWTEQRGPALRAPEVWQSTPDTPTPTTPPPTAPELARFFYDRDALDDFNALLTNVRCLPFTVETLDTQALETLDGTTVASAAEAEQLVRDALLEVAP